MLQGLFLIFLGLLTILSSDFDLNSFIQWLGLILLIFGTILTFAAIKARQKSRNWGSLMTIGSLEILIGTYIIYDPVYSLSIFSLIVGGWAMVIGIYQGFKALKETANKLLLLSNGIVSIAFGLLIIFYPFGNNKALTYLVAMYSLFLGVYILYLSVKARKVYLLANEVVQEG